MSLRLLCLAGLLFYCADGVGRSCDRWAVAAGERCARAAGTRRNETGDRCVRAVAAGLTGSRAGGRLAVVGPGWSGTGAWTSYAPSRSSVRTMIFTSSPTRSEQRSAWLRTGQAMSSG